MKRAAWTLVMAFAACGGGGSGVGSDAAVDGGPPVDAIPIDVLDPPPAPYQVQISESQIGANGHTRREVLVTGVTSTGAPADDAVVLSLDRASAGTLGTTQLTLGPLGASTSFTPCDAAALGCVGSATISVALAANPTTVVAQVAISLVPPVDVSTAAPCTGTGGNVYYLDGTNFHSSTFDMTRIDDAAWDVENAGPNVLDIYATPQDPAEGLGWQFLFQAEGSASTTFTAQTYADAGPLESFPGAALHNGMDFELNGFGCPEGSGAFQIHDITFDPATHLMTSGTITFDSLCPADVPVRLEGCLHYEAP